MLFVPFKELEMRLYQWAVGGKAYPLFCFFYLQEQSKMDDVICPPEDKHRIDEKVTFLGDEEVKDIVSEMAGAGVWDFRLIGGLENHYGFEVIMDVLSSAKAKDSAVSLLSMGMPLNDNEIKRLIKAKIDMFEFIIFGPDENTHFYNREKDESWSNIIRTLAALKKIKGRDVDKIPRIGINVVLTRANWDKLPNMIKFAHRWNADIFKIHLPGPYMISSSKLGLQPQQARDLFLIKDDLANLCRLYHLEHNLDLYQRERLHLSYKPNAKKGSSKTLPDEADFSMYVKRFKKRFPKMEESFIRYATLKDFQSWYMVYMGPEGIFIPSENGRNFVPSHRFLDTHESLEGILDNIWFGETYDKHRMRNLKREIGPIYQGHSLLGQGEIKEIHKGLLKRWRDTSRLQQKKQDVQGNLLKEYRKKETMTEIKMLDKDIQWLKDNISDTERRIELYAKDKERIMRLRESRLFRWYQAIRR